MAHNVKGLRRFGQVIGQCEALTPAQNAAEKKRTKAAGRLRFFVAGGAKRRTVNRMLCDAYASTYIFTLEFIFINT
jgi:hypothetical protein